MNNEQLYQEFKSRMHTEFKIPESKITMDALLKDDLNLDSLDLLEASLVIEDRWGIRLEESELPKVKSVGDMLQWVAARLERQP